MSRLTKLELGVLFCSGFLMTGMQHSLRAVGLCTRYIYHKSHASSPLLTEKSFRSFAVKAVGSVNACKDSSSNLND